MLETIKKAKIFTEKSDNFDDFPSDPNDFAIHANNVLALLRERTRLSMFSATKKELEHEKKQLVETIAANAVNNRIRADIDQASAIVRQEIKTYQQQKIEYVNATMTSIWRETYIR